MFMAAAPGQQWRYSGEWDPSSVDYELEEASLSDHVELARQAKTELNELRARVQTLEHAAALGAETAQVRSGHNRKGGKTNDCL